MGKHSILFVLAILSLAFSHIQAQTCLLRGTVLDENKQVIDYANVLLLSPDSTFIEGAVADQQGHYSIEVVPGKYLLHVKALGFKDILQHVSVPTEGLERTFYMSTNHVALKEVVVTSKTPLVRREADKIIFDASSIAPAGNDALDILKNVPGVVVTNDEVKILGQQGVKILINGREQKMGANELLALLKSYQAGQVDKIEVMTTPSSKFDAEGSAGILNIKLKKNRIDYMGSTLNYGYAYDKYHSNSANVSFIYNRNRVNISLNGYGNWNKSRYEESNHEEYKSYSRRSTSDAINRAAAYNFRGNIDYQISPGATIGALATYNKSKSDNELDGRSTFYSQTTFQADSLLLSENPHDVTNEHYRIGTYLDVKVDTLGRKIHVDLDYLCSDYHSEKLFLSKTYDPLMNDIGGHYGFNNDNGRSIKAVTSAIDFVLPFKSYTFNLGAKVSLAKTKNRMDYYNHTLLDDQKDDFFFTENIYALYADLSKTFSRKLTFKAGVRLEHVYTLGENKEKSNTGSQRNCDRYTRLFPVLYVGYTPHEEHRFNLSLSSRISRPSFRNINPFVLYTNKYATVSGKPDLKPAYTYKVNLGYTLKGNFSIDGFYSYRDNGFTQVQKVDVSNQTIHTFWDNVLDIHTIGINNSYSFNRISWLQLFLIHGMDYKISRSGSAYAIPKRNSLSYIAMVNASIFLNKSRTCIGWVNASYSSPERYATADIRSNYNLGIGGRYALLDNKLKISLSLNNILSSHVKGTVNSPDFKMSFDNIYSYPTVQLSVTYILGAKLSGKRYSNTEIQNRM